MLKVKGSEMGQDLSDPVVFGRAYDEHSRAVYTAAYRILGNAAQAQDVVQDVFLRLWRRPRTFDAQRGELGPYVRMMARSRALDLWREGVVMAYWGGLTADEIARRIEVPLGTAKSRIRLGLEKLRSDGGGSLSPA